MEARLRPPPAHRSRRIADDTAAEDRSTAEFSARPFRPQRGRAPSCLGPSAGHRVVVTVCDSPLVVSALMKVRSTAPQGVGAQASPLPGEYLVGWLTAPRIWTFACGSLGTPSLSRQSVWNSGLPCPNARP